MITFKQYLTEVFDKGYDFEYKGRGKYPDPNIEEHSYKFKTPNDSYVTSLEHNKNSAEVCFRSVKGDYHEVPNQERGTAVKVFSTVKNIIKHHLEKHPHITNVTFDASHMHPSRVKLYDAMIGSLTKKHTRQQGYNTYYSFDTKDIKESINEELVPRIHHGITPRQLMALAKKHGTTRYMIDDKDKIHAARAYDFTHVDIGNTLDDASDTKAEGAVTYNKETGQHLYHAAYWGGDHPHLKTLEKLGCIKGQRDGDYQDLKVIPRNDWKTTVSEVFHDYMPSPYKASKGKLVSIYKNPTRGEVDSIVNKSESKRARGILHDNDAYVFDAMDAIHSDVATHLNIPSKCQDHFCIGRDRISSEYLYGKYTSDHLTKHPWVSKTVPDKRFFHG